MNVAVVTCTRDRLPYTQHCFQSLRENAGIEFDHLILDQASEDGTVDWLRDNYPFTVLIESPENIGVSRGINLLLDTALELGPDVIVKFDNDCELRSPETLRIVCELVEAYPDWLLSPRISGLQWPPPPLGVPVFLDGHWHVTETSVIGGIFLAAPAAMYQAGYRHSETNPLWGGDDVGQCASWRATGGHVGYVEGLEAWHYLSTVGQHADIPEYFERVRAEGKPA